MWRWNRSFGVDLGTWWWYLITMCTTPDCTRPERNPTCGLCQACYRKQRRHADPAIADAARESCKRAYAKKIGRPVRVPSGEAKADARLRNERRRSGIAGTTSERRFGFCPVCPPGTPEQDLVCDHDKITGIIRGWPCRKCDASIGGLGDTAQGLQRALDYLIKKP